MDCKPDRTEKQYRLIENPADTGSGKKSVSQVKMIVNCRSNVIQAGKSELSNVWPANKPIDGETAQIMKDNATD
jgi:hypothetical protein